MTSRPDTLIWISDQERKVHQHWCCRSWTWVWITFAACEHRLIAKKGTQHTLHFAHEVKSDCLWMGKIHTSRKHKLPTEKSSQQVEIALTILIQIGIRSEYMHQNIVSASLTRFFREILFHFTFLKFVTLCIRWSVLLFQDNWPDF